MIHTIDIRSLIPPGPAELGPLIASCRVVRVVDNYSHPAIDIEMPPDFALPESPIDVALYADGKYFGSLILDRDGFRAHPDYLYTSPYFTIAIA